MATCNSSKRRGLSQPPRVSASNKQTNPKMEPMKSFVHWKDDCLGKIIDRKCTGGTRVRLSRSPASTGSDTSSTGNVNAMTDTYSYSSMESATVEPEAIQQEATYTESECSSVDCAASKIPLPRSPHDSVSVDQGKIPSEGDFVEIPDATELPRPPSPREHMSELQAGPPSTSFLGVAPNTIFGSPLDRYLAQEEFATETTVGSIIREEEWDRLRALRTEALKLRDRTKSKRQEVQQKQQAKISADEAFMHYVRSLRLSTDSREVAHTFSDPGLDAYYKAMQDARDLCGPEEYEYGMLEDKLDAIEFDIARAEARVYQLESRKFSRNDNLTSAAQVMSGPFPMPPESLLGMSEDSRDYDPLHADYLSALGDLDLAKESLRDLFRDQQDLLRLKLSRAHANEELDEDEQEFLATFASHKAELIGEIAAVEQDVERKKEACLKAGIDISDSVNWDGQEEAEEAPTTEVKNMSIAEEPIYSATASKLYTAPESSHRMFPVLLPATGPARDDLKCLITSFDENDKGDRIKRWMLEMLRTSPLEIQLLVRCFLQVLDIVNFSKWQTSVLDWQFSVLFYWDVDESNRPAEQFENSDTHSSTDQIDLSAQFVRRGRSRTDSKNWKHTAAMSFKADRRTKSAPGSVDLGNILQGSDTLRVLGP